MNISRDSENWLEAFDPRTGHKVWTSPLDVEAIESFIDGQFLFTAGNKVVQIDAGSGKVTWEARVRRVQVAARAGRYVVAWAASGEVSAYDSASGRHLWTKRLGTRFDGGWLPGLLSGDRLVVVDLNENTSEAVPRLVGVDIATGRRTWGPQPVYGDVAELGWSDSFLVAQESDLQLVDMSSGERIASAPIEKGSYLELATGAVYLVEGESDATLTVMRLDPSMERIGTVDVGAIDEDASVQMLAVPRGVMLRVDDRITRYG